MKVGDLVKFKIASAQAFNVVDKLGIIISVNVKLWSSDPDPEIIGGKVLINDFKLYHPQLSRLVEVISEV